MQAIKSLARAGATLQSVAAQQTRQMSAVGTTPLVRLSFTEKLAHGILITTALCAVPVWVLVNIRYYRGLEK